MQDGKFYKDGQPFQGVGINYYTVLQRKLGIEGHPSNLSDTSYRGGLETLAQHDIPFIRFGANGFYPTDWDVYLNHKEEYFKAFDAMVADAERLKIGNEWIHDADLPGDEHGRGWTEPDHAPKPPLGLAKTRTIKDKMFRKNIYVGYQAFVNTVRAIDPLRPVFSGDAMPRPSAYQHPFPRPPVFAKASTGTPIS